MRTLRRKLARDLWRLRYQVLTIALVVGCGMASFVSMTSAAASVRASRDAFYADARFADVFVRLKRAPSPVLDRIRDLPGVTRVDGRVSEDCRLLLGEGSEPALLHIVSVQWHEDSQLNQTRILSGRQVEPGRADEIVLGQALADTWHLAPGSRVSVVIRGRRATLRVVGVAVSPEFVWASEPRTGLPDPWHFGVGWMERDALAKADGFSGAFNDVAIQLSAGADERETIDRIDAILEPYGGLGAVGRSNQPSARLLDQKIEQLGRVSHTVPFIFLAIAAFLLHVLLSRIVGTQREQIATLKALGYRTRELTRHFLEFAAVICALGAALGALLGILAAKGILAAYARYFHFPEYLFRFGAWTVAGSTAIAIVAGVGGTLTAIRRTTSVPPAEAMRPEAPPSYKPSPLDRAYALLPPMGRMVLRDVMRRPGRLLLSAGSIALATAVVLAGSVMSDSMDEMLRLEFEVSEREDLTAVLDDARAWRAVREAAHIPGVIEAQGERRVPVRLRAGSRMRSTAILGVSPQADLHRVLGADRQPLALPLSGLSLSRPLAESLDVRPGDTVDVEVLESDRRKVRVPIAALVDDLIGITGYMDASELAARLGQEPRVNLLLLGVDHGDIDAVTRRLDDMTYVSSVTRPSAARELVRAQDGDVFVVFQVVLAVFAAAIAVGVVYNNARIALEVRSRDLATMRILGFARSELALVLLGEQAVQVMLGVPVGLYLGRAIGGLSLSTIDRELLRIPVTLLPSSYVVAVFVVVLAAVASALIVRRQSDRLDLVAVLKARD